MNTDEPYNSSLDAAEDYQDQIDTLLAEVKRFEQVKKWVYAHKKYPTITKIHLKDLMDIIEEGAA